MNLKKKLSKLMKHKTVRVILFLGNTTDENHFFMNFRQSLHSIEIKTNFEEDLDILRQKYLSHCKCINLFITS